MEMKYLLRRKQYTAALVCVGSWRVENKTITTAQCSAVKRCTIKIKITMTITLTITKTISKTITAAQCSQMLYNSLSLRSIGIHSLCDGVEKVRGRSHCLLACLLEDRTACCCCVPLCTALSSVPAHFSTGIHHSD